jgi:hypothetical protein
MDKVCSRCKETKEFSQFYKKKHQKSGFSSECKSCYLTWMHANKNNNPNFEGSKTCSECNEIKPKSKFHRQNQSQDGLKNTCKDCINLERRYTRYGLSKEEYDSILKQQDYKCAICRYDKRLDVDHCHSTGKVRGILCNGCNTAIGKLGDTLEGIQRAINYLSI